MTMHYIKMGKRYINMSRVVEIEYMRATTYGPEEYRLWLDYTVDGTPNYIVVDGADMIALEQYLDNDDIVTDIRAPMMAEE